MDLYLTDMVSCKAQILSQIADHKALLITVPSVMPESVNIYRDVWHFKGAAWKNMRCELAACSWTCLERGTVDEAVNQFMHILHNSCVRYIPKGTIAMEKQTHPWIDDACRHAIEKKGDSEGTDQYEEKRDECARVLNESFQLYVDKLKDRISKLQKGSKL